MKKREFILTLTFSLPLPSSMLKLPKYRAGGRKLKRRARVGRARASGKGTREGRGSTLYARPPPEQAFKVKEAPGNRPD